MIGERSVPLADVACILTGVATQWSGELVALAAHHDVVILTCDWRGVPVSATVPWADNARIAARQQAQAGLSLPRKKNAWMRIVRAKILGQASNLEAHDPVSALRLTDLASRVRSGDPNNVEASAARTYWARYLPSERFVRDRDANDRNALLNYGYAIARGMTIRAIAQAGLNPALGIHHHNRSNPFGLADDLIEPLRPAVDWCVRQLPKGSSLEQPSVKASLVSVLSMAMETDGRTVSTCASGLAISLARYVEGDESVLTVPKWTALLG